MCVHSVQTLKILCEAFFTGLTVSVAACGFFPQGGHVLTPLPYATPMKPGSAVSITLAYSLCIFSRVIAQLNAVCQLCSYLDQEILHTFIYINQWGSCQGKLQVAGISLPHLWTLSQPLYAYIAIATHTSLCTLLKCHLSAPLCPLSEPHCISIAPSHSSMHPHTQFQALPHTPVPPCAFSMTLTDAPSLTFAKSHSPHTFPEPSFVSLAHPLVLFPICQQPLIYLPASHQGLAISFWLPH